MQTHRALRPSIAGLAVLSAIASIAVAPASCGDDASSTACDTATDEGCPTGQHCIDRGGDLGCYCDVDANTGCDGVCLADPEGEPACYCDTETEAGCPAGQVCEEVVGGYPACFPPVTVTGQVFDLETDDPIEGALVVARDASFAAVSGVATTDATGAYELAVPTPRNEDGSLTELQIFLRADADAYLTFPSPPRSALPIDVSAATGTPPTIQSSATDIGMVPLMDTDGLGTVTGKVVADVPIGTLVVAGGAEQAGGGATGIADGDGTYTVFNVPAGATTVRGYKAGLQIDPASAEVTAGAVTAGVDLVATGPATAVVSGKIDIVNPGNGSSTSVILAVDETFIPSAARGEAPPGLRIAPVSGDFSIPDVPDGHYVVLAAFENDFLVRDPDVSIGGTGLVRIAVAGGDVSIGETFKITGSLDDVSPDGEEEVTGTPTFHWADDSGEDHYEVRVFDAYGNQVWEDTSVPGVSGNQGVSVTYAGPPLESGFLYQFRAVSIKQNGSPISATEDLRGVFLYR